MSFAQSDHSDTFHPAAQWTLRPYLAQGPAAAIFSQGWLSDPSQRISGYKGQISLHNTTTVMMHYQNSAVHAARGFLEHIRNICGVKILDNLHLGVIMGGNACSPLQGLIKILSSQNVSSVSCTLNQQLGTIPDKQPDFFMRHDCNFLYLCPLPFTKKL